MLFAREGYGGVRRLYHLLVSIVLTVTAAAAPAAEPQRLILAFGDSLTAGYQLKPTDSFPAQLEAALRKTGRNVRVHNAGVSGDTTTQGRARLNWVLTGLKTKPDLVILELGANDMLRGQPPATAKANLDAMLAEFKRRQIPVVLAGMLANPGLGRPYAAEFNAIYPALAKRYATPLYPFFTEGVTGKPSLLLSDGLHPTPRGVGVIVRGILPVVTKALAAS